MKQGDSDPKEHRIVLRWTRGAMKALAWAIAIGAGLAGVAGDKLKPLVSALFPVLVALALISTAALLQLSPEDRTSSSGYESMSGGIAL